MIRAFIILTINSFIIEDFNLLIFAQRCIKTAKIPSCINKISSYSFDKCTILETIEFSYHLKLKKIRNNAFPYSSIKNIKIPEHLKCIGQIAFCGCKTF